MPETFTRQLPTWTKNKMKNSARPNFVQTLFERKSQAHSVLA
jgi:hypothetical protein